ncbi:DMT family transporter [Paenibacillus sp. P26]|nr:DMT family transporter [Paenibacillus sp. P26]
MKGDQISLSSIAGAILLLLSCVSFAGYSVMARSLSKQFRPVELSYLMMGLAFAAMLVISLAEHAAKGTLNRMLVPLSEPSFLVAVLYLGILSSLVTSWLSNYALSKLEASRTSVFSNLGTVVSIAAGAMFLGERIYGYHIIGTVMIIAGVIGVNLLGDKKTGTRPQNSTALRGK